MLNSIDQFLWPFLFSSSIIHLTSRKTGSCRVTLLLLLFIQTHVSPTGFHSLSISLFLSSLSFFFCASISHSPCLLWGRERGTTAPHEAHVKQSGASWPGEIDCRWRSFMYTTSHSVSSDVPLVSNEFCATHGHLIFYHSLIVTHQQVDCQRAVLSSCHSYLSQYRLVSCLLFAFSLSYFCLHFVFNTHRVKRDDQWFLWKLFEWEWRRKLCHSRAAWDERTLQQLIHKQIQKRRQRERERESWLVVQRERVRVPIRVPLRVWWLEWWVTWYTLTTFLRYEWVFYLFRDFLVTSHRVSLCIWEFILSFSWNDWISWFESCKCLWRERKICLSLSPWLKALKRSYELVNCWLHGTYQWWR